jgi:MFS transporter, putative metabolite:H+ symporter
MRILNAVVVAAALGTFVDVLDLTLFQSVRVASLKDLGVAGPDLFRTGIMLLNLQLAGLLIGGILWGLIADRKGRRTVLFASILMYSLTTLACAWVNSVPLYAVLRFIGGIGLAGEMGAGVTLIVEVMPRESRGYGTTVCAAAGVSGAIAGGILASHLPWRTAYIIGGVAGLGLFVLRASTAESNMFTRSRAAAKSRGGLALFRDWATAKRFILSLALGLPIFFVLLIVAPFAPEIGAALPPGHSMTAAIGTGAVALGLTVGDVVSGLLSQKMKSRKRPIAINLGLLAVLLVVFFFVPVPTDRAFAGLILALGFAAGYFVLFLTNAAEQFGTNLRGTAAVSAPNIMRAMVIPMTILMKVLSPSMGLRMALVAISGVSIVIALLALRALPETFGRDLDFDE